MESVSLFSELNSGGYDSCIMTTYNAYFPFYEEVLLRRLRNKGVSRNIVLIDSKQCKAAMQESFPLLAGRQYTLAPMSCDAAFHPKIILLLGKKKGLLAVGSHNLTFAGLGTNAEITNIIKFTLGKDESRLGVFWQAW